MTKLVLVRHGQASFGEEDYDKLSTLGHQQSEWLGFFLRAKGYRFDRIVQGSLRRHKETTDRILSAGYTVQPDTDERLNELEYDVLERDYLMSTGAKPANNREDFLHAFPAIFEGWSEGRFGQAHFSHEAFEARIHAALDDVKGGSTLFVTSGGVIGTIMRWAMDLDVRMAANMILMIHNASFHELHFESGHWRVSGFNATPHLDDTTKTYV